MVEDRIPANAQPLFATMVNTNDDCAIVSSLEIAMDPRTRIAMRTIRVPRDLNGICFMVVFGQVRKKCHHPKTASLGRIKILMLGCMPLLTPNFHNPATTTVAPTNFFFAAERAAARPGV